MLPLVALGLSLGGAASSASGTVPLVAPLRSPIAFAAAEPIAQSPSPSPVVDPDTNSFRWSEAGLALAFWAPLNAAAIVTLVLVAPSASGCGGDWGCFFTQLFKLFALVIVGALAAALNLASPTLASLGAWLVDRDRPRAGNFGKSIGAAYVGCAMGWVFWILGIALNNAFGPANSILYVGLIAGLIAQVVLVPLAASFGLHWSTSPGAPKPLASSDPATALLPGVDALRATWPRAPTVLNVAF